MSSSILEVILDYFDIWYNVKDMQIAFILCCIRDNNKKQSQYLLSKNEVFFLQYLTLWIQLLA